MKLTLGFSPCPNDTFIFDALVNGLIDTRGLEFDYVMEDVATLNQWAQQGRLQITKLSYNTFLHTVGTYALLHSGSALGEGVGPLLIAREPIPLSQIDQCTIAIPGFSTTANLLLSLAFSGARLKTERVFSEIEEAVSSGQFDAGLIIHESRFTYARKGLHKLIDLGDWWEQATQAAIPLGGIVIRRDIASQLGATIDALIRESLEWSWRRYPELSDFIRHNAQEMEEDVMRQHINLYVNQYSADLGDRGRNAIHILFEKAKAAGLLAGETEAPIFYDGQ